jgi:hypothetical protein
LLDTQLYIHTPFREGSLSVSDVSSVCDNI